MFIDVLLLIVLAICFFTDCREQKIYNIVVLPSIIAVFIINILMFGFDGFKLSSLGFLTGFGILLIPYVLGGMGAGDVKLLAFIGAAKGIAFVLNSAIYMAIVGGVISIGILIFNKHLVVFIKLIISWITSLLYNTGRKIELSNTGAKNKFPYGIAIVAGALISLFFKGAWIL